VRKDLESIAAALRAYESKYGGFPTNEEGLVVLDAFAENYSPPLAQPIAAYDRMLHANSDSLGLGDLRMVGLLQTQDERLERAQPEAYAAAFRDHNTGLPASAPSSQAARDGVHYILTKKYLLLLCTRAGIHDRWLVPLVYENRRDAPEGAFAGSPAGPGWGKGNFCIEAAPDIWVWSVGGKQFTDQIAVERRAVRQKSVAGGFLWSLGLAMLIGMCIWRRRALRRLGKRSRLWVLAVVGAAASLLPVAEPELFRATCYIMSPLFQDRNRPAMMVRRRELLDKHLQRGVISQATYERCKQAMDRTEREASQGP
jgi:hypothetical protein